MPGTNAAIFSIANILRTGETNHFLVPTINAIIILKKSFEKKYSRNGFYDISTTQPIL